jgi:ABC-2 type transport system permease protein
VSRAGRLQSAFLAAWRSFLRRRVAVFFTFFFPAIIILIFGALIQTGSGGEGLFARPAGYYVPGYLAVVVIQTPLSRVGSEVARHREGNRFEKLATTPLTRAEWLLAQTLVNVALVGIAAVLVLALVLLTTDAGATFALDPLLLVTVPAGTVLFCGLGALLGRLADSQDGAITAANAVGLPLLLLSETFVPPSLLPDWFVPLLSLSPLTYFSRATRAAAYQAPIDNGFVAAPFGDATGPLVVLLGLAVAFFAAGALAIPTTD